MREINRIITVSELHEGDEVLIASSARLRLVKIMRTPRLSKKHKDRYSSLPCMLKEEQVASRWDPNYKYGRLTANIDAEYNVVKRLNLTWSEMWLVKKGDEK